MNFKKALSKTFNWLWTHKFLWVSMALVGGMFAFHYWMILPILSANLTPSSVLLLKDGWHPPIITWLLEGIYALFNIHLYHLLLLTIIPFYLGIWIIVLAAWEKNTFLLVATFCFSLFYLQYLLYVF